MLLERRQGLDQPLLCYGIGVICLCVIMFMLGSTMTLWTMQFAFDQTDNPVLEGYSVPTAVSNLTPAMTTTPTGETPPLAKREVNEQGLLRPPTLEPERSHSSPGMPRPGGARRSKDCAAI